MTVPPDPVGAAVPPPVDPFDPVALEARLAEARARRARVLRARVEPAAASAGAASALEPVWRFAGGFARRLRATPGFLLGLGLGAGLAAPLVVALVPSPPPAPAAATVDAAPATVAPPVKVAALVMPTALLNPLPAAAAPRPMPRPADHAVASAAVTRSARNAPATLPPQVAVRRLARDVNAATVGRAAATLGVRERVALPGLPLSITLDRRGLRVLEHSGRGSKGRRRGRD
jgi:hypothetical protein